MCQPVTRRYASPVGGRDPFPPWSPTPGPACPTPPRDAPASPRSVGVVGPPRSAGRAPVAIVGVVYALLLLAIVLLLPV